MSLQNRESWNRWRRNESIMVRKKRREKRNEKMTKRNEARQEGRRKWKKSVKYEDLPLWKLERNCISIRANCRGVREDGRDRATNLFEGGNTRANKFPCGEEIPVRNPIRIGASGVGGRGRRHSSGKLQEIREYSCRLYRRIRSDEHSFPPRC